MSQNIRGGTARELTPLKINSDGNIGRGTTSPSERLHVYRVGVLEPKFQSSNGRVGLQLTAGDTGDANWILYSGYPAAGDFAIREGGVANHIVVKKTSGSVGIGTASPTDTLEISGGVRIQPSSGNAYVRLTDAGTRNWDLKVVDGSDYFEIGGTSSTSLTVKGNGNVGIGTTSPANKLSITDGASPYTTANVLLQIKRNATNGNDDTSKAAIQLGNNSNAFQIAYGGTSDRLRFLDGGAVERITLLNGGSVGIGTTSPSYPLQVQYAGGAAIGMQVKGTSNRAKLVVTDNDTSTYLIAEDSMSSIGRNDSLSTSNLTINASGCVGIGVTNPSQKLDVRGGNIYIESGYKITWSNGDAEIIEGRTSNYSLALRTYDGSSAMVTNMFLKSGGNVGIGTETPGGVFHVNGTSGAGWDRNILLSMDGTTLGRIIVDSEGIKYRTAVSGDDHTFRNSGNATTLRIKESGKLGIGLNNTGPNETADVAGSIKYGTSTDHEIVYHSTTSTIAGDTPTTINWKNGTTTLDRTYTYKIAVLSLPSALGTLAPL